MVIETLSEFIEWAAQFYDGQYLFRGVSNDSYEIQASACRRLPEAQRNNPARLLRLNQDLIEKAKSRGHNQKDGQQLYDLELLAELQHYGAATCLIDFTRNALVALWFACQQSSKGNQKNGKVFAVRSDDPARFKTVTPDLMEEKIDNFFKPDQQGKYSLYQWEPKYQNNRIIAQHSVFVFGGAQFETEAECVIMLSSKQAILESLNQLSDITEASMYPDFDGFARLHAHDKPYIEPNAKGYLLRGIQAHQRGDRDDAIAYYTEVIELNPSDTTAVAESYNNRGAAYAKRSDYARAIEDFSKAISLNLYGGGVYYNRGIAYADKGDFERAIKDLSKAIVLDSDNAEAYNSRGAAYGEKGNYERTISDCTRAIELNPNYVEAYSNRGAAYNSQGDYQRAIKDCTRAIELNPNYAEAYSNRGLAYNSQGDYEHAIEDCTRAIELNPNYATAYNNRGVSYGKTREFKRAIEDCTRAIELNPNYVEAYSNRGLAYNSQGDYEHAIEDCTRAIELNPNYATAYNNRGIAYGQKGDYDHAIKDFDKAIDLNPNYDTPHINRGIIYRNQGDYESAISDFERVIEFDPQNRRAHNLRQAVQKELENSNRQ